MDLSYTSLVCFNRVLAILQDRYLEIQAQIVQWITQKRDVLDVVSIGERDQNVALPFYLLPLIFGIIIVPWTSYSIHIVRRV